MLIVGTILIVYALITLIVPDLWWLMYAAGHKQPFRNVERTQDLDRQRVKASLSALVVGIIGVVLHFSWI